MICSHIVSFGKAHGISVPKFGSTQALRLSVPKAVVRGLGEERVQAAARCCAARRERNVHQLSVPKVVGAAHGRWPGFARSAAFRPAARQATRSRLEGSCRRPHRPVFPARAAPWLLNGGLCVLAGPKAPKAPKGPAPRISVPKVQAKRPVGPVFQSGKAMHASGWAWPRRAAVTESMNFRYRKSFRACPEFVSSRLDAVHRPGTSGRTRPHAGIFLAPVSRLCAAVPPVTELARRLAGVQPWPIAHTARLPHCC